MCLPLWFCLKEWRMGWSLAVFIHHLFPLPCSGWKRRWGTWLQVCIWRKTGPTTASCVLWFFSPLRFTKNYVKICFLFLHQEVKHSWVDDCALVILTYLHDPWSPHTDSFLYHTAKQKPLLSSQRKETQWIEKWLLANSKEMPLQTLNMFWPLFKGKLVVTELTFVFFSVAQSWNQLPAK